MLEYILTCCFEPPLKVKILSKATVHVLDPWLQNGTGLKSQTLVSWQKQCMLLEQQVSLGLQQGGWGHVCTGIIEIWLN